MFKSSAADQGTCIPAMGEGGEVSRIHPKGKLRRLSEAGRAYLFSPGQ